jgi:mitochondrial chaperone BCS1
MSFPALSGNQFASGGLLLMAIGAVGASLRKIPSRLWKLALHQFTLSLTMTDESQALVWFKWWFQQHKRSTQIRHLDVFTPFPEVALLQPAPGAHWFSFHGRPLRMSFARTEDKKIMAQTRSETITIHLFGRNQNILRDFVNEARRAYEEKTVSKPRLYSWIGSWWEEIKFDPRPLGSVILPPKTKAEIVSDIQHFKSDTDFYKSTGIPYHRSYLFHGPPGTGKTSFILGLAAHFNANVYLLKLSMMSDAMLTEALYRVGRNAMVILEDVDCAVHRREDIVKEKKPATPAQSSKKEPKTDGRLTLSGLLNALDGIETPEGVIFFLTTNFYRKLDSALLRPGRIDVKLELGEAQPAEKHEMYRRFFPDHDESVAQSFLLKSKAKVMAELQEELKLARRNS